jgi:hypothetical protein
VKDKLSTTNKRTRSIGSCRKEMYPDQEEELIKKLLEWRKEGVPLAYSHLIIEMRELVENETFKTSYGWIRGSWFDIKATNSKIPNLVPELTNTNSITSLLSSVEWNNTPCYGKSFFYIFRSGLDRQIVSSHFAQIGYIYPQNVEWGCMALAGCTEWTTRSPRASQPLKIPNKTI